MVFDNLYTGANGLIYIQAALSMGTVFGWIQLGLAIVMTLVGIAYKVWKWHKEAAADGEITPEELKQLIDENKDDVIEVITESKELVKDIVDKTSNKNN